MKKNPFLTVMIIPHTEDGPKSIKISVLLVRVLSVVLITGIMFSYLWFYNFVYIKRQNEALKIVQTEDKAVIKNYTSNYLDLFQDVETLKEKIVSVESLEEQVRTQNGFDPTRSYFDKQNQSALAELQSIDKPKVTAASVDTAIGEAKKDISTLQEAIPSKEKSLNELIGLMDDRSEYLLSIPSIWPTVGVITSPYGYRRDPINGSTSFHTGLDIANVYGTPVYAAADGIVELASWHGGYGNEVMINHGNGLETIYGHNSRIVVKKGQFVRKGQLISYMGSTGRSTGPHSHFEIKKYGKPVNPLNYINK